MLLSNLANCVLVIFTVLTVSSCHHRFGYSRGDQRLWKKRHEGCSGQYQSPISISSRRAIPVRMPALEFVHYHNLLPGPLQVNNNGHSVSLILPLVDGNISLPYITGGKLPPHEFELVGLHYHWGDKNNRGSEHVVNDIRYPLEMHIIHRNRKYDTVAEAIQHKDGLTVLAFFYQIKEAESPEITNIVRSLHEMDDTNNTAILDFTFTLQTLIGNVNTDRFYTYKGSLTTPPCSEVVTWVIFPDTLSVSLSQISKFRQLSNLVDGVLADNFRNLQPIRNRKIYLRSVNSRYTKLEDVKYKVDDSDWYY